MKNINLFNWLREGSTLKRVGMILALCLMTITQVWADNCGFYGSGAAYIRLWVNNSKSVYLNCYADGVSDVELGVVDELYLAEMRALTWKWNTGNVCGVRMYYGVNATRNGTEGSNYYIEHNQTDYGDWTGTSGDDDHKTIQQYRAWPSSLDLLDGLTPGQDYYLDFCLKIKGSVSSNWECNEDQVALDNNGGNYHVHFRVADSKSTFTAGKYLYFDARELTSWQTNNPDIQFFFKEYYYGNDDIDDVKCLKTNALENWVYYVTVPSGSRNGTVEIDRVRPAGSSDPTEYWNKTNYMYACDRDNASQNCLIGSGSDKWSSWSPTWGTYCPPMSASTLTDNGTTLNWGGSGTSGSPYLIPTSASIKVSASSTSALNDANMTKYYLFKKAGTAQGSGSSTNTKTITASSTTGTKEAITVESYNYYNSTEGTHLTSNSIYYEVRTPYTISYNKGTGGSGTRSNETKLKGVNFTLPGSAVFTKDGYTQTGWTTSNGGSQTHGLGGSYTTDAAQAFYPVWTAKTITLTLNPNTTHRGTGSNVSVTATYNSVLPSFSEAVPTSGYQLDGYYTAADKGTKIVNADGSLVRNVSGYTSNEETPKWLYYSGNVTLYAHYVGYPSGYIYITDIKATPESGPTATKSGGSYTGIDASVDYNDFPGREYMLTSGADNTYTLTFSPALDVSGYENLKLDFWWGTNVDNNRGYAIKLNGSDVTSGAADSKTRQKVLTVSDIEITATSISTIQIKGGGGGGGSLFFRIGIKGDEVSCSAPTSLSISGETEYDALGDISLTASATGTSSGVTEYTWYKGATWDAASSADPVQATSTSGATFAIDDCTTSAAGTYWCLISNGTGCEDKVSATVTVSCLTAPSAVTSLSNSAHTATSLTYTWSKATNASGYTATIYTNSACTTQVASQNLGDVATVTFTSLTPNTTYYCKVQSKGNGSVYCVDGGTTSEVSGTTDAPSAPTFSPTSGSTVSGSQSITITGHSGSTVYYAWATSAQSASDIYNSGSGSHGTADAGTASTTVQSGKTLYAISRLSSVNSAVSSASYTVDATAPTLSSSTPADDATSVATSGNIQLTFSENVTIANASKFSLSGGTLSTGSASVSGAVVTIPYSGLSNSTEYTFSTAAGAVQDAVGNTNAALDDISFTTKAAPTCSGDPSALTSNELYTIDEMVSNCSETEISSTTSGGTGIYQYGLSNNGKFYVVGTYNGDDGSTGTVEMKKQGDGTITVKGETFTYISWFKGLGSTSCRSIKFVTPSAGTLIIYGKVSSKKGNIELKQGSSSAVDVMENSKNGSDSVHVNITAGATCYLWADGASAALYGLYFDKAPALSSSDPADGDTDVPVSGTIVLTFDESITDVDDDKFSLSTGSISAVAVDGTDDTKINITYSGLPGSTEVTLSVAAGAVTDEAGNTSAALSDIAFTTVATGYAITNADPDNGTIAITDGSSDITEAEKDATVHIEATPATGYEFTSWSVKGDTSGDDIGVATSSSTNPTTFTMPGEAVTVDATFTAIDYAITHSAASNGTYTIKVGSADAVSTNTTANYNQTITLAATPSSHYKLQAWNVTCGGDPVAVTNNQFSMPAGNVTIAPTFGAVYTVTFNSNGGSSVDAIEQSTVGGAIEMPDGPTKDDYTFVNWMIGGTTKDAGDSYTPTANVTAHATWKAECEGDDPVLAIGASEATESDYLGTYSTEGITISSDQSWKGNDDKYGPVIALEASSTGYDNTYLEVLASSYNISKVSFLLTGNGSDKSLQPVVFGWASTASSTADTYRMLDAQTVSNKGYDNAEWFTYDFSASELKRVRIYRASKNVSSTSPSHTGSSTAIGNAATIWIYGIKVWLDDGSGTCYYVTYNGNGATSGYVNDPIAHESGSDVMVQNNPALTGFTRTGYEFNGWNTEDDGSGTHYDYWDIDHNEIEDIAADVDLYAEWRIVINADNTDFAGKDAPTAYKDVKVTNGATLTITNATTVRDITVTDGATLKLQKGTTAHDVTVETGSTLNVNTTNGDGTGDGITLTANSLALNGGWNDAKTKYDMPRVYIDPKSTLTKTVDVVNFDISVDYHNYYPIALPFDVELDDVDYAESYIAAASIYGTHYEIQEYNGQSRANSGGGNGNWSVVESGATLKAGKGYILFAKTVGGKGIIRFPMTVDNAWTAGGEKGSASYDADDDGEDEEHTKNVVAVTAYKKTGSGPGTGDETPKANIGWNLLGVPYMSCYTTGDGMYDEDNVDDPATLINGKLNITTGAYSEEEIPYVTVPVHDFSEYIQASLEDAVLLPGWCFFVQVEKSGNLTFLSESEAANSDLQIYAPKREQASMPTVKTGIILSGNGASDKTTILVSDKYSAADYEINADLEKMFGENGYTLATYSLSGATRLAFNALSNAEAANVIPIGYRAPANGDYTFSINPRYAENFAQVNLIDYEEGIITNLLMSSYTFTTERTQNDSRFAINVVPQQGIMTDLEETDGGKADAKVRKVIINDKMYILIDGKMYDATGKCVK